MSVNTLAQPDREPAKDRTGLVTESQLESLGKTARQLWTAAQPLDGTKGFDRDGVAVSFADRVAHYSRFGEDDAEIDLFIEPDGDNEAKLNVAIDTVKPTGRSEGDGAYTYERQFFPLEYGGEAAFTTETGDFDEEGALFLGKGDLKEINKGEMTAAEYAELDKALNDLLGPDVQFRPDLPERQPN